jgi:hypothetical protein
MRLEEYGTLSISGKADEAFMFHGTVADGHRIITMDKADQSLSIFVIKGSVIKLKQADINKQCPSTLPKMGNYRMAKKCKIALDQTPVCMDFYQSKIILCYEGSSVIDVFTKEGEAFKQFDVEGILEDHKLEFLKITSVLFPRLQWSDRKIDYFYQGNPSEIHPGKLILIGKCIVA